MHDELYAIVFRITKAQGIANGKGMDVGLLVAGQALQRASQLLVPVNLGNLKSSAFTRLVHDNKGKG